MPLIAASADGMTLVYSDSPLGVIGLITPWNGPFVLVMNQAVQAILAGNTVVAKGSEVTPYSAKLAETILLDAGLPLGGNSARGLGTGIGPIAARLVSDESSTMKWMSPQSNE